MCTILATFKVKESKAKLSPGSSVQPLPNPWHCPEIEEKGRLSVPFRVESRRSLGRAGDSLNLLINKSQKWSYQNWTIISRTKADSTVQPFQNHDATWNCTKGLPVHSVSCRESKDARPRRWQPQPTDEQQPSKVKLSESNRYHKN